MGAGMDKIMPGLYVGSIRDSRDREQIKKNNITHILTIYEDPKDGTVENITYKCFKASDHASQDIKQFFAEAIDFIHKARLENGNVLVHCLAGISRSTTLAISYMMTVTELPWYDSLNACRAARNQTNPNFGFQRQLQNFEYTSIKIVRENLFKKYGEYDKANDLLHCKSLLEIYHQKNKPVVSSISNDQVNYNVNRTYPLAFNAYNLDEEKAVNINDVNLKTSEANKEKTEQVEIADEQRNRLSEDESKKEKDKIVEKLFG